MKHFKQILSICFVFSLFFLLQPHLVRAVELKTGSSVTIRTPATIDESLAVTGESIIVDSNVNGDLYCAGQDITINGNVTGDVLCGGQHIRINGIVNGNVRVGGQSVDITNHVMKNVNAFGQRVTLDTQSIVDGEVLSGAQYLNLEGRIGNKVTGWAKNASLGGSMGDTVTLQTTNLNVENSATIAGNLNYESSSNAIVQPGASISGNIVKTSPPVKPEEHITPRNIQSRAVRTGLSGIYVLYSLLFGGLLLLIAKTRIIKKLEYLQGSSLMTFFLGLIFLMVLPILFIFLVLTIIGIPLALIGALVIILMYFFGRALVAFYVGKILVDKVSPKNSLSLGWSLVAGILVTWVAYSVPVLGGIVSFLATVFGFGIIITSFFPHRFNNKK